MNDENTQSPEVTPSEAPAVETTPETPSEQPQTEEAQAPSEQAVEDTALSAAVETAVAAATSDEGVPPAQIKLETVEDLLERVMAQLGVSVSVNAIEGEPNAVKVSVDLVNGTAERSLSGVIRDNDQKEILGFYHAVCDAHFENMRHNDTRTA